MKIQTILLSASLVFFLINTMHSQETKTYTHPGGEFSFKATGEWINNPKHKDKMIYEMVNTEKDLHVMLWYNGGTESSREDYLKKMADMKGLEFDTFQNWHLDGKTICTLDCRGENDGKAERRILAAMSYKKAYGKDAGERHQGKSYNEMHIAQIWCPAERYEENKDAIVGIITSLELDKQ